MDTINTIVPIVLILIAVIWIYSVFGEPIKHFYEWIKGFMSSRRERFQPPNPANVIKEFTYN